MKYYFPFNAYGICDILLQMHKGMLQMKYKVKRIEEDLNFGCEERLEDTPVMAIVTLIDEEKREIELRQPDQMLYNRDINEGDEVFLNEKQELQKCP